MKQFLNLLRLSIINHLFLPEPIWRRPHAYGYEADYITPQAFGRNTFSDRGVGAIVCTALDHFIDDITTFEWLKSQKFDPGCPNMMLGLRCIELAEFKLGNVSKPDASIRPVIGQWEVLYAMYLHNPEWYEQHRDALVVIWPPPEDYLGTRGMLLEVREIAEKRSLTKPLLAAHPEHIQRCFFIARKIFPRSPIAIDYMMDANEKWFDPHSVQRWTRGPNVWLFYEMLTRIHHRLNGWM